jgi:hypothetical protein
MRPLAIPHVPVTAWAPIESHATAMGSLDPLVRVLGCLSVAGDCVRQFTAFPRNRHLIRFSPVTRRGQPSTRPWA